MIKRRSIPSRRLTARCCTGFIHVGTGTSEPTFSSYIIPNRHRPNRSALCTTALRILGMVSIDIIIMSGVDLGIAVGATSLLTAILAKTKCYYKMNSEYPCACGFTDVQLADNDDVHINHTSVNGIDPLYVGKRKSTTDEKNKFIAHDETDEDKTKHIGCIFN